MDDIDDIFSAKAAEPEKAPEPVPSAPVDTVAAGEVPTTTPMRSLANYVMSRYRENHDFRNRTGVTERLDYCIRAQKCQFSDDQKSKLLRKFGKDLVERIFVPITSVKNRAARAMLVDLVNQSGDPLFRIEPTPVPEVSMDVAMAAMKKTFSEIVQLFSVIQAGGSVPTEEIQQKINELVSDTVEKRNDDVKNSIDEFARTRADRMQAKVWDIMEEGGFNKAFEEYIDYICTYGTGIIIGPIVRNVAKKETRKDKYGVARYRMTYRPEPVYEAVNPMDCYPAPDAKEVDDGAFCMTVKYTGESLWRYSSGAGDGDLHGGGWMKDTVREILARNPRGGVKLNISTFDATRRVCENNGFETTEDCTFDGIRCFASVRGSELLEMGISKAPDGRKVEASDYYKTETVVIDNFVVYCRIYPDEMETPISKGVFYTLPGSWWGEAISDKVAMTQSVLNNCIVALLQNMSASSTSVFWINDVQRMFNKSPDAMKIKAGMTVAFSNANTFGASAGAPIGALTIPSNATELMGVFKQMQTQADIDSGLPAYTEGHSAGASGAMRTAAGLQMFTEASSRGLKMVMTTSDHCVISRIARMTADWVLLNDPDDSLKGDVCVRSVGLIGKILKAQRDQMRLNVLQLVLNSPLLSQALGVRGILELFRPSLKDIDINPDDIMPSKGKLDQMEAIEAIKALFQAQYGQEQAAPQGGSPEGIENPVPGGVEERRAVA